MRNAEGDETAMQVARLTDGVRAGRAQLVLASGPARRAHLAVALLASLGSAALVVSADTQRAIDAIHEDTRLPRRVPSLPLHLDGADLEMRLRELGDARSPVSIVHPDRLWQAPIARAIRALQPPLVIVIGDALAAGLAERHLALLSLLRRIRVLLPDTTFILLSQPVLPTQEQTLAAAIAAAITRVGPLLVPQVAPHLVPLNHERDRVPGIIERLAAPGFSLISAPTRKAAVAIAAALRRSGWDAEAYHGGLLPAEAAALLDAVRQGRQRVLVCTEALARVSRLPPPEALLCSQPPRTAEWLLLLAERAEQRASPVPLSILYTAADIGGIVGAARGAAPTLATLRRSYAAVQRLAARGHLLLDLERSRAGVALPTQWRLCLDLLVSAGYLARRDDFPRAATLTLARDIDALAALRRAVALRPGTPIPVETLALAAALGLRPDELHRLLLDAADAGALILRTVGREALYALLAPPQDGAVRLARGLASLTQLGAASGEAVRVFMRARRCRAQALAERYGWSPPAPCGVCDLCAPALSDTEHAPEWSIALRALVALPRGLPRGAAVRAAQRALIAHGHRRSAAQVGRLLDRLLARGLLEPRAGSLGTLLAVGPAGVRALAGVEAVHSGGGEPAQREGEGS